MNNLARIVILCITTLTLASCASEPPLILQLPEAETTVSLNNPELKSAIGQTVRWGGIILEVINKKDSSQLIILGYPLTSQARPNTYSQAGIRRFIANFNHFIEPNNYTKNSEITIIGKLERIEESKVGEFNYEYPVVSVEKHSLWINSGYYDPYYYNGYNQWYGYSPHYYYPTYWDYDSHHFSGHHY